MEFEWDDSKNDANLTKHGIDFDEVARVFLCRILEFNDNRYDYGEVRVKAIGVVDGRELAVVYTVRGENYRIISARKANRNERRAYRQAQTR